jgi:hypothetical protein
VDRSGIRDGQGLGHVDPSARVRSR